MRSFAKGPKGIAVSCALTVVLGLAGLAGCAPTVVEAPSRAADGISAADLAPLTEDIYYQGSAAPANEPHTEGVPEAAADAAAAAEREAAASGDINAILTSCSGSCHDMAQLEAYTASPEEVQAEMETMATYVQPALTADQVTALVDYYNEK